MVYKMMLSLLLPIYNEEANLRKNFMKIYRYTMALCDAEIIILENGRSSDATRMLAENFAKMKGVRYISVMKKGRGGALKMGIREAKGSIIGYMDIDLAVPLKYVSKAVSLAKDKYEFITGSRYAHGADAKRSTKRLIASIVYNSLPRIVFGSYVSDHQCGFKFWRASYIKKAERKIKDTHWFFDTEAIIRAENAGIKVYEMPVEWSEGKSTKVRISDITYFIRSIASLRNNLLHGND
jgi:glycosyltransferase involved in cell wall biosynthesis